MAGAFSATLVGRRAPTPAKRQSKIVNVVERSCAAPTTAICGESLCLFMF